MHDDNDGWMAPLAKKKETTAHSPGRCGRCIYCGKHTEGQGLICLERTLALVLDALTTDDDKGSPPAVKKNGKNTCKVCGSETGADTRGICTSCGCFHSGKGPND